MSNEMSIELVLKAWQFLLDYHGLEAELEIVDQDKEDKNEDRDVRGTDPETNSQRGRLRSKLT